MRTVIWLSEWTRPLAERLEAERLTLIVFGAVDRTIGARQRDRRIEHHRGGGEAVLQRRCVDERFERGAGLAHRLGGAVELRQTERIAADHRQDCGPNARLQRHDRAVDGWGLAKIVAVARRPVGSTKTRSPTLRPPLPALAQITSLGSSSPAPPAGRMTCTAIAGNLVDGRYASRRGVSDGATLPCRILFPAGLEVGVLERAAPAVATVIGLQPASSGRHERRSANLESRVVRT